MQWVVRRHRRFRKELGGLTMQEQHRVVQGLRRLVARLNSGAASDARAIAHGRPIDVSPDLRTLQGSRTTGSYRLRVGDVRAFLVLMPDERIVLLTTLAKRTDSTYSRAVKRHDARVASADDRDEND